MRSRSQRTSDVMNKQWRHQSPSDPKGSNEVIFVRIWHCNKYKNLTKTFCWKREITKGADESEIVTFAFFDSKKKNRKIRLVVGFLLGILLGTRHFRTTLSLKFYNRGVFRFGGNPGKSQLLRSPPKQEILNYYFFLKLIIYSYWINK